MRIGLVGYGTGGQHFHAPFIAAAEGVELAGVVARAPETIAKVEGDLPGTPIYPSLAAMIAAGGIDAVTITTPPQTRRALVLEAIAAGLHVIADKPFAPSAEGARELDAAAKAKGVVLGVFHNRRFDADVQTLRKVITDGRLGRLWRVHSRMDFDDPATLEAGPTGGLLRDLGSHIIDQILWLLGPAVSVDAQLDMVELPEGTTDAGFTITIRHESGVHSHLSASKLNRLTAKEIGLTAKQAATCLREPTCRRRRSSPAAARPTTLSAGDTSARNIGEPCAPPPARSEVPSEQGRYHDYYEGFARAVRDGTAPPATAEEATRTLAVLDAARKSAAEGRSVGVEPARK